MTLIINAEQHTDPEIVGVVCDRCKSEVRGDVELQEVIHLRLRAGYGSIWGDGNVVECDLCDGCGHLLLDPYGKVVPSIELYSGHVMTGLNTLWLNSVAADSPNVVIDRAREGEAAHRSREQRQRARILFELRRYFLPATVLLAPVWRWLVGLNTAINREERALRQTYGFTRED